MSISGFVFRYRKITVNRGYYVVFVLPMGLFFLFFVFSCCLHGVYVWSGLRYLCRKEQSVHGMSSVW